MPGVDGFISTRSCILCEQIHISNHTHNHGHRVEERENIDCHYPTDVPSNVLILHDKEDAEEGANEQTHCLELKNQEIY